MGKPLNEKGMTLVELLAAITILSIVLGMFATFFTQSALFTKKNEEAIEAMSLARLVLDDLRENPSRLSGVNGNDMIYESFNQVGLPVIPSVNQDGTFQSNAQFKLKLKVEIPTIFHENQEIQLEVYKVTIEIYKTSGEKVTETYGLIEVSS